MVRSVTIAPVQSRSGTVRSLPAWAEDRVPRLMVSTAKASMAFSFDDMLLLLFLIIFTSTIKALPSNANIFVTVF
jgi:hypothetical protein